MTSVEDAPRPCQAQRDVTPQNIAAVEAIVMENRRVTLNDNAACLKMGFQEEVRHAVHEWLRGLSKEFFSKGIYALCKRWRVCIKRGGDYVEK